MSRANTDRSYGSVTRTFHWLIAVLIVSMIPLGIVANDLPFDTSEELARKAMLFQIHKTLGVFIFFLALARIVWALTQPKPVPLHPERRAETFLASLVHWLLYGSLVLVPLTGWITHAATEGFAPIWWPFGQDLPFVPDSDAVAQTFATLHIIFERVLLIAILLHVAGALKHHFLDRDATLRRMWRGTPAGEGTHRTTFAPPLAALGVYVLALGIGAGMGLFAMEERAEAAALDTVASDWTVAEGTLALTVSQFGSEVTGAFEDWTAAITFDPDLPASDTPVGTARVTVSIPSMTLGSVTSEATGPDFLDAAAFPNAIYDAELYRTDTGFEARGTLTLRGVTQPLTFPFDLALDGDTATVSATMTLNRLDYGIGQTMPDESTVAFAVDLAIDLVATRAE